MTEKTRATKSFWKRPEGVAGAIFGGLLITGIALLLYSNWGLLLAATQNILFLTLILLVLSVIAYMIIDPAMRNLISYMYRSMMRSIAGIFITIDPIKVLKNYVNDLDNNLNRMNRQINKLRQQMHLLKEHIQQNKKDIAENLNQASQAKEKNKRNVMILKSRKAGRLKESNLKLDDLLRKMEVLYKVLSRMYDNSYILKEDIEDQVNLKEKERDAIHASHSAMQSAMNIISGNKDKRHQFNEALEAIADDVSHKVGELEQFMEMSESFMQSIDLEKGIFEERGLEMLEKWESEESSLLLGEDKGHLLLEAERESDELTLNEPMKQAQKLQQSANQYDSFFDFDED